MTDRILRQPDAIALAAIITAAHTGAHVARDRGGDIIEGTARSIGDHLGAYLGPDEDVRDGLLRVTTVNGWEAFWPMVELVEEYKQLTFVVEEDAS